MLDRYRHTGRNPIRNLVVFLLFGAITVVFIFWGLSPKNAGNVASGGSVAEVNGELISIADFEHERTRLSEMYGNMFGQKFNSDAQKQLLSGQALGGLISLELLSQSANSQGLVISKDEIRDQIVTIPAFQKDGKFQRAYYEAYLNSVRMRAVDFEKRLRKVQQYQRVSRAFESALSPLGLENQKQFVLANSRVNLSFLRISREDVAQNLSVATAQAEAFVADAQNQSRLQEHYNANPNLFKDKEKVKTFDEAKLDVAKSVLKLEQADHQMKSLEEVMKQGDAKAIETWAQQNKVKWDETGDFPLSAQQIPKIGPSEQFVQAAFKLGKDKPQFIREAGVSYVVKLKSRTEADSKGTQDDFTQQTLVSRRAQESMGKYLEGLRSSASIHENTAILRQ